MRQPFGVRFSDAAFSPDDVWGSRVQGLRVTWRFMGGYKWSYQSRNIAHNYSYPTYNPTYNYP